MATALLASSGRAARCRLRSSSLARGGCTAGTSAAAPPIRCLDTPHCGWAKSRSASGPSRCWQVSPD